MPLQRKTLDDRDLPGGKSYARKQVAEPHRVEGHSLREKNLT